MSAPDNKWLAEAKQVTIALGKQAGFGWASIPNRKLETVSGTEIKPFPKNIGNIIDVIINGRRQQFNTFVHKHMQRERSYIIQIQGIKYNESNSRSWRVWVLAHGVICSHKPETGLLG